MLPFRGGNHLFKVALSKQEDAVYSGAARLGLVFDKLSKSPEPAETLHYKSHGCPSKQQETTASESSLLLSLTYTHGWERGHVERADANSTVTYEKCKWHCDSLMWQISFLIPLMCISRVVDVKNVLHDKDLTENTIMCNFTQIALRALIFKVIFGQISSSHDCLDM